MSDNRPDDADYDEPERPKPRPKPFVLFSDDDDRPRAFAEYEIRPKSDVLLVELGRSLDW